MSPIRNYNRIITLLTDFGLQDTYAAVMKGVILKINPNAKIIDLTHLIPPQDIQGASYALYSSYRFFPEGTIHIAVVDPGVGTSRRLICAEIARQYFLAPDNGLLTFILKDERPARISELDVKRLSLSNRSRTFHGRDILAPAAAYLSIGKPAKLFAIDIEATLSTFNMSPIVSKNGLLKGEIIYIDGFGNLITNIDHKIFSKVRERKEPIICIKGHSIQGLSKFYSEKRKGEPLALWNSSSLLEISVNQASAKEALKAKRGDRVVVMC